VGIVGSAATLLVMSYGKAGWPQVLTGSILLGGIGISGMHYTAMAAMRLPATQHHTPILVMSAIGLAVALSFIALMSDIGLLVYRGAR
jgi:NO-binding membrane sensor protein with MHYT domain